MSTRTEKVLFAIATSILGCMIVWLVIAAVDAVSL